MLTAYRSAVNKAMEYVNNLTRNSGNQVVIDGGANKGSVPNSKVQNQTPNISKTSGSTTPDPAKTTGGSTIPKSIFENLQDLQNSLTVQLPITFEMFQNPNVLTPLSSAVSYEPFIIQLERVETNDKSFLSKLKSFGFTSLPTIVFYISPFEMQRSYEKVINESWTARGIVPEYSGEQPDKISFSGKTGGFYTKEYGLTRLFRRQSAAYLQLMQLLSFFKNNAYKYELEPQTTNRGITTKALSENNIYRGTIKSIGNVIIYYREEVFSGYFDSMSITDSAESPFNMEYKFDFVVRQWYNSRMAASYNIPAVQGHTTAPPEALDTLSNASQKR
jgi:hypothetical protein